MLDEVNKGVTKYYREEKHRDQKVEQEKSQVEENPKQVGFEAMLIAIGGPGGVKCSVGFFSCQVTY